MSEKMPQTYANHRRFDPPYHFLLSSILVVNVGITAWALIRMIKGQHFDFATLWNLIMAAAFILLFFKLRLYALRNQDRLIRLEEQLRMKALLPAPLAVRALGLRPAQYVALRFAGDEELSGLVQQTLDEDLGQEDIKKRIKAWRGDHFRV